MEEQQLRDYLEQLSGEIKTMDASDEDKQRLSDLIVDIEQQLAEPVLEEEPQNLADQVDSLVASFENEHPTVSGILHNIMITLSSMGV